ncbi:MAG: hypothetical protein M9894_16525 [Planctomycetes bacterium]|nr:hypothetical protein [Planctomycetota bacterium]
MTPPSDAPDDEVARPGPGARAVLVGAAARGAAFGLPPALLVVALGVASDGPLPALLGAAVAAMVVGCVPAASAAVELGWPGRGVRRHDLAAAGVALLAGALAFVAVLFQLRYAEGVLVGAVPPLHFDATWDGRLALAAGALGGAASAVLAVGVLLRRGGRSPEACRWAMAAAAGAMLVVVRFVSEAPQGLSHGLAEVIGWVVLGLPLGWFTAGLCELADTATSRIGGAAATSAT